MSVDHQHCRQGPATVGILMLETSFPRIPGDIGNPATFKFPVLYEVVKGASPERVVLRPDGTLLQRFIAGAQRMERAGAKAIATSCGFLALFHQELLQAVSVPVFTSSLLQVHLARALIRQDQVVGILTAHAQALTDAHLEAVGLNRRRLAVMGMDDFAEFQSVFMHGKPNLDVEACGLEMEEAAAKLLRLHPDVGAIVLECTNMPPYSSRIRRATGLPVFDAVTLVNYAHSVVATRREAPGAR